MATLGALQPQKRPVGPLFCCTTPVSPHESREGSGCLLAPLARVTGPGPCLHLTPGLQSHSDQSWGCAEPPGLHGLTCVCIKRRNSFSLVLSPSSCACAHLHCSDKDVPTRPETASSGRSQYLWGGKEKNPVLEPEIGKAKGFVFHPQTSAMQQVELSQETPSKPTAHEAALGKQHLKGPSVLARPVLALEGRSDPVPGLQDWGPSAVP